MLELCGIRSSLCGDVNQLDTAIEISVVIRRDVRDEVRRIRFAQDFIGNAKFRHLRYHRWLI
jgi:hypothetical protein